MLCVVLLSCDDSCSSETLISHGSTTEKLIEWLDMISWPTVVFALVFCAFLVKYNKGCAYTLGNRHMIPLAACREVIYQPYR